MGTGSGFVVYLPSFDFDNDALLVLVDYEAIDWLMSQFGRLSDAPPGSSCPSFVIGDGEPVKSDGCLIVVEANKQLEGSQLVRKSDNSFNWSVSRAAAHRYKELLSGLLVSQPRHQYLDSDDMPHVPAVIISRGEYSDEWLADARRKLRNEAK